MPELVEDVVTPSVAADEAEAKLQVEALLAEMAKIDEESARLNAILELEDMKRQLLAAALGDDDGGGDAGEATAARSSSTDGGRERLSAQDQARLDQLPRR